MSVDADMPLREVKNHLSEVVGQVEREHNRVTITQHGRPAAVVISADDLGSLEETLDILSRPALTEWIRCETIRIASASLCALSWPGSTVRDGAITASSTESMTRRRCRFRVRRPSSPA